MGMLKYWIYLICSFLNVEAFALSLHIKFDQTTALPHSVIEIALHEFSTKIVSLKFLLMEIDLFG